MEASYAAAPTPPTDILVMSKPYASTLIDRYKSRLEAIEVQRITIVCRL